MSGSRRGMVRWLRPTDGRWWVSFALLFALAGLWSLASPLFSVIDEPAHVIKAAAVARGQVFPTEVPGRPSQASVVEVPQILASALGDPCIGAQPDVVPRCAPRLQGTTRLVAAYTPAGRYAPAYYFLVGLPSLLFPSTTGVYLMRLVSAGLSAVFLASAFSSARAAAPSRSVVWGVAVAVSPMVLFFAGSVNPNGVEIAAAACLWASLITLVLRRDQAEPGRLVARAGLAAAALVVSRPLSPLWVLVIAATILAMSRRHSLEVLVRDRAVWIGTGVTGAAALAAVGWTLTAGALELVPAITGASSSGFNQIVRQSTGKTSNEVLHMIGVFGWLDTPSPLVTYYAWFACIGFLVLAGLAWGRGREALVLAALVLVVVVLPRAIEISQARTLGLVWQGRYTLPLAVGVPMLAALLASELWAVAGNRLGKVLSGVIVVGHVAAFAKGLFRNAVGVDGPFWPGDWPDGGTAVVLMAVFTLAMLLFGWWLVRLAEPAERKGDRASPGEMAALSRLATGAGGGRARPRYK